MRSSSGIPASSAATTAPANCSPSRRPGLRAEQVERADVFAGHHAPASRRRTGSRWPAWQDRRPATGRRRGRRGRSPEPERAGDRVQAWALAEGELQLVVSARRTRRWSQEFRRWRRRRPARWPRRRCRRGRRTPRTAGRPRLPRACLRRRRAAAGGLPHLAETWPGGCHGARGSRWRGHPFTIPYPERL